jgi:hypothetical protein
MKRIYKITVIVFAVITGLFLIYCLVAILVWKNVAIGSDIKATDLIREEFTKAVGTNFSRQLEFVVSPSHNKTIVHVGIDLNDEEKARLETLAKEISHTNADRIVQIKFDLPH